MTYAIVGDGERCRGQVWEAVQFAAQLQKSRFVLIAIMNKKATDGLVDDVCCALTCRASSAHSAFEAYHRRRAMTWPRSQTCLIEICACGDHVRPSVLFAGFRQLLGGCNFAEETFDNH